jgi:hypothetical protein
MRTIFSIISPVLPISIGIFIFVIVISGPSGPCGSVGYLIGYPIGFVGILVGLGLSANRAIRHFGKRHKSNKTEENSN